MLIETFFRIQRNEKEDISTHVAKLQKLFLDLNTELARHNENTLSERILTGRILSTLGKEYDNFKDLWDTIPSDDQKLNLLIEKLCAIELREMSNDLTESSKMNAFFAREGNKKGKTANLKEINKEKSRNYDHAKKKFPCHKCKQLGHWAAECPQKAIGKPGKRNVNKSFFAYSMGASVNKYTDVDKWYCDSGASQHITPSKQYFTSYMPFVIPETISLGKQDVVMEAYGHGTIDIQVFYKGVWRNAELKNVLYVPDASAHLFSVKAAARNGYNTTMNQKGVLVCERSNRVPLISGYIYKDLYVLNMRVLKPKNAIQVNLTASTKTLQLYHERFAHQNKQHVKQVLKDMNIAVNTTEEEFCDGCILGKMHRLPFKQRKDRPVSVGELINTDVNGPMNITSLGGARYYVCFKDDYSKFRRLFFLKYKSEVCKVLEQFLNEARTNGHTVKTLRCDGGREFNNKDVAELLARQGIEFCISSPYTPEQNGAAERENRTIVEAARSMLNPSKLPKALWAEACNTASYILNRTGKSPIDGKSPYELWHKRKVGNLDNLRIFGTGCYVHIPKGFRTKFDNKAVFGHMVGYVNNKDGYRVWIPSQKRIVLSHDVRFKPEVLCSTSKCTTNECTEKEEECQQCNVKTDIGLIECNEKPDELQPQENTVSISGGSAEVTIQDEDNSVSISGGSAEVIQDQDNIPIRKSIRERQKPTWMKSNEFVCMTATEIDTYADPNSYSEAINSDESEQWFKAMQDELNSLKENETWDLVKRPVNVQVIKNRWVFRRKIANDGTAFLKARLVAKGYVQKQGIDYEETFSPVARYDTIRMLIAMACKNRMKLKQFDVKTAFLNGLLEENVYLEQPEGFEDGSECVCLLKRSLYGLKQAPRCWNKRFMQFMKKAGLQNSKTDPCLFYRKCNQSSLYVAIYVDDGLVAGNNEKEIEAFLEELKQEFKVTIGSLENFLGMKITQNHDASITVSQKAYTEKILEKFRMNNSNVVSTPVSREESENTENLTEKVPYREAVGSLMYLAMTTRPDIAFAVGKAARAMEKPTSWDWNNIKRIFRYLRGTSDYGITYTKDDGQLKVYSDADFAGDKTRRSTTGVIATFANGPVSWISQLQKTVALSTMEAEIIAASEGAKELIWLKRLFSELTHSPEVESTPTLYVDNASAVKLAKNPEFHKRSKHIDVRHFFVREQFLNGRIRLEHINGQEQLADLLTKPLERVRFETLRKKIGIQSSD